MYLCWIKLPATNDNESHPLSSVFLFHQI